MSKLLIDTRWQGKHGIGRYACEIIKYLPQNFITTSKHIKPFSLKDLFYLSFLIRKKMFWDIILLLRMFHCLYF